MQDNNDYALHYACKKSNFKSVIRILKNKKHDINLKDAEGMTPLLYACKSNSFQIVEMLITYGANPHVVNDDNFNAISFIAQHGNRKLIKLISKHNVDPNITDKNNHTPLYYAYLSNHLFCIEHLLENGARVNKALIQKIKKVNQNTHNKGFKLLTSFYDIQTKLEEVISKPTSHSNTTLFKEEMCKAEKLNIKSLALYTIKRTLKYENFYCLAALINSKHPNKICIQSLLDEQNIDTLKLLLHLNLIIHPEPNLFSYLLEAALQDKKQHEKIIAVLLE